jgi:hypothetical protein
MLLALQMVDVVLVTHVRLCLLTSGSFRRLSGAQCLQAITLRP